MVDMINFGSKYMTILAIIFLIFVGYQNTKQYRNSIAPKISQPSSIPSVRAPVFSYKIDPSKKEEDLSFIDKLFMNMVNNKYSTNIITPSSIPQSIPDLMRVIHVGDQVKLIYKTQESPQAEPEPIIITIGANQIPVKVEQSLVGLKVGDVRFIEMDNKKYTRIEVLSINNTKTGQASDK